MRDDIRKSKVFTVSRSQIIRLIGFLVGLFLWHRILSQLVESDLIILYGMAAAIVISILTPYILVWACFLIAVVVTVTVLVPVTIVLLSVDTIEKILSWLNRVAHGRALGAFGLILAFLGVIFQIVDSF